MKFSILRSYKHSTNLLILTARSQGAHIFCADEIRPTFGTKCGIVIAFHRRAHRSPKVRTDNRKVYCLKSPPRCSYRTALSHAFRDLQGYQCSPRVAGGWLTLVYRMPVIMAPGVHCLGHDATPFRCSESGHDHNRGRVQHLIDAD